MDWQRIGTQLAADWHWIGNGLEMDWHWIGTRLVFDWRRIGLVGLRPLETHPILYQGLHYKTLWNSCILLPYTPPLFRSNCSTLKVYIPPFVPFQLFHHQSLHSTVFANMVVAPRLEIGCNPDTITMDRTFLNILKQVPASVTLLVILKIRVRIAVHEIIPP